MYILRENYCPNDYFQTLVKQATRYHVVPDLDKVVTGNVQSVVDDSIYNAKFALHEPTDGSSHIELGNWEEILPDDQKEAGVQPAHSTNNFDPYLFKKELVDRSKCTSNIRLCVVNVRNWPLRVFLNFIRK